MAHEREVAGVRCGEVLADLSDYVDGALSSERAGVIEAHLRGCDWCERFGGAFSDAVAALRRQLAEPEPLPPDLRARLRRRIRDVAGA